MSKTRHLSSVEQNVFDDLIEWWHEAYGHRTGDDIDAAFTFMDLTPDEYGEWVMLNPLPVEAIERVARRHAAMFWKSSESRVRYTRENAEKRSDS